MARFKLFSTEYEVEAVSIDIYYEDDTDELIIEVITSGWECRLILQDDEIKELYKALKEAVELRKRLREDD